MEQSDNQDLEQQGMAIYEYIVDNAEGELEDMKGLITRLKTVDVCGQFLASTARYLSAVNPEKFAEWIPMLVEGTIEKDRERRYIGSLLEAIWGEDYESRCEELSACDDNFRRIYKRLHPEYNAM